MQRFVSKNSLVKVIVTTQVLASCIEIMGIETIVCFNR